jgi:murein DD-endopeptidase MepM/ murein hydrolase activator NlpD
MRFRSGGCRFFLTASLITFFAGSLFAEEKTHVVQNGDTLYSLSRLYGVKTQDILFLNGITDTAKIKAGQKLKIPGASIVLEPVKQEPAKTSSAVLQSSASLKTPAPAFIEHKAEKGETLFGIAKSYGVTVEKIQSANNLSSKYVLKAGDKLKIPAANGGLPQALAPVAAKSRNETPSSPVETAVLWPVSVKSAALMTGKLSGVVLTAEKNEPVRCIAAGTVVSAGPYRGFGRVVIVQTSEDYLYVYGGCESLLVKEGDRVVSGTELGRLGVDTVSGKPELCFMVYRNNSPVDPVKAPRA